MKLLSATVLFLAIVLFLGCHKSAETKTPALTGKWSLTETYVSPGDGSVTWHPVNSADSYIQFNSDSSMESNFTNNEAISFNGNLIKYSLLNDSTINVTNTDGISFIRFFKINANTLTITGGCFEGCGSRYKK